MGVKVLNFIRKGFSFFTILFILTSSYGQFYHGLEVGVNLTNASFITNTTPDETSSEIGFSFGYLAERDLSDNLYVRVAVLANRRGVTAWEDRWGLGVIEIPINFGYYLNWNNRNLQFFVDAGLGLDVNINAFTEIDGEKIDVDIGADKDIKRTSTGFNVGTGLLIKKRVKIRINYYNSFTNVFNIEGDEWKNRAFGISVNYFLKEREPY